jgi:phage-related protein
MTSYYNVSIRTTTFKPIIVVNFSGNASFLICYNAVITEEQTEFDTINIDIKTRTKR